MNSELKNLKKRVIYRLTYTGTKETDSLYKIKIINKINLLNIKELKLLLNLFEDYSDLEIFNFITKKILPNNKYKMLIKKLK
tara:strand:+ start:148 stop:393 length:246 start_codon:yes stop_codon:yes gene_type:complete